MQQIEYKDRILVSTRIRFGFWQRILLLFHAEIIIQHDIDCENVAGRTKGILNITIQSYWDKLKYWYIEKRGLNKVQLYEKK